MTMHDSTKAPLVYNGEVIRDRQEMLSLTDMWKAADSQSGRAPSDWLALESTKEFVAVVAASLNAGISGIMTKKGKGGGTYAHWQIALAYAKYLSPEFHMWCNSVVRAHMEGRTHGAGPESQREADPLSPQAKLTAAREIRAHVEGFMKLFTSGGLKGARMLHAVSRATAATTGFDLLSASGVGYLAADAAEPLLLPTELGRMIGITARKVNEVLTEEGYQARQEKPKGGFRYVLTEKGGRAGGQVCLVARVNTAGTEDEVRWPASVADLVADALSSGRLL